MEGVQVGKVSRRSARPVHVVCPGCVSLSDAVQCLCEVVKGCVRVWEDILGCGVILLRGGCSSWEGHLRLCTSCSRPVHVVGPGCLRSGHALQGLAKPV